MQQFRRVFRVRHYECDLYGHVNNANYVRYMQEAAFDASAAVGYDEARYHAMGTMWLVHSTDIEYLNPLAIIAAASGPDRRRDGCQRHDRLGLS